MKATIKALRSEGAKAASHPAEIIHERAAQRKKQHEDEI